MTRVPNKALQPAPEPALRMRKIYRASIFAGFYFGVWLFVAVIWFSLFSRVSHDERIWVTLLWVAFGIVGVPSLFAHVTIDDSGIEQRFFKRRSVTWGDIISWQRHGSPEGEGPETLMIETRQGPFRLNHNCIFGKRLTEVEAELRRRLGDTSRQKKRAS